MIKNSSHSWDSIIKMRRITLNRFSIIWLLRNGDQIEFTDNLTQWAKQNGLPKGSLYKVAMGSKKQTICNGWSVKRIDLSTLTEEQSDSLEKLLTKHNKEFLPKFNRLKPIFTTFKDIVAENFESYRNEKAAEPEP